MTIDQAIQILMDLTTTLPQTSPEKRREAVQLGIEALKREQDCREGEAPEYITLLPGETKEEA